MNTDNFYLKQDEPMQSCLLAMRQIILAQDEQIWETIKYGCQCFMYKKRMFCYLMIEKKSGQPYILMVEGNLLPHPELEQGDRKRMKIYRFDENTDIKIEEVERILQAGLNLYRNGIVRS